MTFLADLHAYLLTERPELHVETRNDGATLLIRERPPEGGPGGGPGRPVFVVEQMDDAVLLEGLWRLPLGDGSEEEVRRFLMEYVQEGIENHGWEVPVVLVGGPRHGTHLSKAREDLVGRLMLARKGGEDGEAEAHLYKWHLKRNAQGEYVCVYEKTLRGDDVDEFLARGVERTGPFVLIHDRPGS